MLQRLVAMRQEVLYGIYLDLHKACKALDRERALEGKLLGIVNLLRRQWRDAKMVARASGYHGKPFQAGQGVTQVYPPCFSTLW